MRAAGRLVAAGCSAAPTADGHIPVPFSFFLPLLPPFSTEQHFPFPPPSPFPTAGVGGKGRGGRGGKGRPRGRGSARVPPPGRAEAARSLLPSPRLPPRPPRGARSQPGPLGAPPPHSLRGSLAEKELGMKEGPRALLCFPSCGAPTLCGVGLSPRPQAGGGCSSRVYQKRGKGRRVPQPWEKNAERDSRLWTRSFPFWGEN